MSFLFSLLCLWACLVCSVLDTKADVIQDQIYDLLSNTDYCVRLLHVNGWIGCATPSGGWDGELRYVSDQNSLTALIQQQTTRNTRVALVITPNLFNRATLVLIRSSLVVAGVMVLYSGSSSPLPLSPYTNPDSQTPQSPNATQVPNFASNSPFYNNGQLYQWNAAGDGLSMEQFNFGIVRLSAASSPTVLSSALSNENNIKKNYHASHSANFNFRMFAEQDSINCLNQSTCFPVGSQSVWWTAGRQLNETNATIVMAMSHVDSTAFLHSTAHGANSDASGWVAMMGAHHALTQVLPSSVLLSLPSIIVFAAFNGEAWANVGSRKFVDDILNFKCAVPNSASPLTACTQPYKPFLAFQNLSLSRISRIIELNQIGFNSTLHLHHDRNNSMSSSPSPALAAYINDVQSIALNMSISAVTAGVNAPALTVSVNLPSPSLPGLPPSSASAFVRASPSIPTLVLADHYASYASPYYHSTDDTPSSLPSSVTSRLCSAATLTARTLFLSAGGNPTLLPTIIADCGIVTQLWNCITTSWSCPLFANFIQFTPLPTGVLPSRYSSIYQLVQPKFIGGLPLLINFMASTWSLNLTAPIDPVTGIQSSTSSLPPNVVWFHDAVDPVLQFDYTAALWRIPASSVNQSYIWTESNWDNGVGVTLYMTESATTELLMLLSGILILILSFAFVAAAKVYCATHFKPL